MEKLNISEKEENAKKMSREIYATDGKYLLYQLSEEDKDNYLSNSGRLCETVFDKETMWKNALYGESKSFSIYDREGAYCGNVELQEPDSITPQIGIVLLECKRNRGIAARAVQMLAKRVLLEKKLEYFLIKIKESNAHSRHVFEKMGAILIDKGECEKEIIQNEIKSLLAPLTEEQLQLLLSNISKLENIYHYKLLPEVFQ